MLGGTQKGETPILSDKDVLNGVDQHIPYLKDDIMILKRGLNFYKDRGLTKMTQSACALASFKKIHGEFKGTFPKGDYELFRSAYRGGLCMVNPLWQYKDAPGYIYDVNSLYVYTMYDKLLPYGSYVEVKGYKIPGEREVAIYYGFLEFRYHAHVLPYLLLQVDGIRRYPKEWYGYTMITNVDLEMLRKVAKVEFECLSSYIFQASNRNFKDYLTHWINEKTKTERDTLWYDTAKRMGNGLYGKFGTNPHNTIHVPYLEGDKIKWEIVPGEPKETVYLPVAIFTASYARAHTYQGMIDVGFDNVQYCDTDSIHTNIDCSDKLNINDTIPGAWKLETIKDHAEYFKAKRYKLMANNAPKFKGITPVEKIEYSDFSVGKPIKVKRSKQVESGRIIETVDQLLLPTNLYFNLEDYLND